MAQSQLEVYRTDMKYIRNLHNIDDRVLSESPQMGKDERPFLGVIIVCNTHKYCILLSKPKKNIKSFSRLKNDVRRNCHVKLPDMPCGKSGSFSLVRLAAHVSNG